MSVPSAKDITAIRKLVDGFRANLVELLGPNTSEAVTRLEYLDPFWKALGWDVTNRARRPAAEKDVLIEARVRTIEGERTRSRRSDYLFRIDGFPRFFVEAKKPASDLKTNKDAIFQAKTYAWNAQIPFAIVTDFEEFRLFDATIKPYINEPQRGLIEEFDLRFEDYVTQWDVLWNTFSREAVAGGSLERLLALIKKVRAGRRIRGFDRMLFDLRGTEPVGKVFLAHLEDYRLRFARALYQENRKQFPEAETRHGAAKLTEATQRLLDRLVFMRVCEDRDIIPYGTLRKTVDEVVEDRLDLYTVLSGRFREFDSRYNGYLFKAHFSEHLQVPGQLLADFIRSLYPPEAPYRFDIIRDDLLGIVYERFLGSTITVTKGHVSAEQKPEVRHAGGVYYTPRFVVDTIIRRVVGPQLKGKRPLEILDVRILDPACGSGSFLIAAFQYLMDHCVRYIADHPAAAEVPASPRARKRKRKLAFQDSDGQWHLTPDFKTQILTSCLYGIDIDAQAVEVTIMSLYIKTLEGRLPKNWQRELLAERLLPPLDNNIRCGNSLLSQTDFDSYLEDKHGGLFPFDDEIRFRINAFDWTSQTRGFGRLLNEGEGFDGIIGNPPYIRVQELKKWAPDECEFYKWQYKSAAKGNYDIYVAFIERGLQLLAPGGLLGFICPHKFWQAAYGKGIRKIIGDGKHLRSLIDFADQQVFRGATTYTAIHVFSKEPNAGSVDYTRITELTDGESQCRTLDGGRHIEGSTRFQAKRPTSPEAWTFLDLPSANLMEKMREVGPPLSQIVDRIFVGLQTSADDVFILESHDTRYQSEAIHEVVELEKDLLHPLLKGSVHIRRWLADRTPKVVLFPYESCAGGWELIQADTLESHYPKTWDYLCRCRKRLTARERGTFGGEMWYGYVYPKNLAMMGRPKILTPSLGQRSEFCLDERGEFYFVGSGGGGAVVMGLLFPQISRPISSSAS